MVVIGITAEGGCVTQHTGGFKESGVSCIVPNRRVSRRKPCFSYAGGAFRPQHMSTCGVIAKNGDRHVSLRSLVSVPVFRSALPGD